MFLDAFAGSGQMGIEALSRGAAEAVFIDNSRRSVDTVRKNLETTGLSDRARVISTDTLSYLSRTDTKFDIAFLDPPYETGLLQAALEKLPKVMKAGGVIICERPVSEELPVTAGEFEVKKHYKYGKIMITVYSHKDVEGI